MTTNNGTRSPAQIALLTLSALTLLAAFSSIWWPPIRINNHTVPPFTVTAVLCTAWLALIVECIERSTTRRRERLLAMAVLAVVPPLLLQILVGHEV